jgi:hypothetical protein
MAGYDTPSVASQGDGQHGKHDGRELAGSFRAVLALTAWRLLDDG